MVGFCKWISWQEYGDRVIIINHKRANERIILEHVSRDIWKMINNNNSIKYIIEKLKNDYKNISTFDLEKDVREFLNSLELLEIIEEKENIDE